MPRDTHIMRGHLHRSPEAVAHREELARTVWAQVHAERAARPQAKKPRRQVTASLAPAAQAHLEAGGCSGDFCPHCTGTGWAYELYDRDRATECRCFYCHGRGMGK